MANSRLANNTTNYDHPDEAHLTNLHYAMEYNTSGQPVLRVNQTPADPSVFVGNVDASSDAFGRLRVSDSFTLFDSSLRYADDPYKWDNELTGNATKTFLPNESSTLLTVNGAGASCVRETKKVFSYQPGKSLLVMMTFALATQQSNLVQRVGYFGAQNGVFFEQNDTGLCFVIRKYTGGSVDDTSEKVYQSDWNIDRLNGLGGTYNASNINLDITKTQIWFCDIEWLGVGSVRVGFVINGEFKLCHIFHHANIADKVYMTTASLPCRYEIRSTGATASMRAICSTVISEGGYVNRSISRTASTELTGKALSNFSMRPLVSIRLRSDRLDSIVVPTKYDLLGLQQAAFKYALILNPTIAGAIWVNPDPYSSVEYDISATTISGGIIVDSGIFVGGNKGGSASVSASEVDFSHQLGRFLNGTSDIFVLAAQATTNNDDAVGSLTWQEH